MSRIHFAPTLEDIVFMTVTSPSHDMVFTALRMCRDLGVSLVEIKGTDRSRHIAHARHYIIWTIHQEFPDISSSEIGRFFNRESSTVRHAIRAVEDRIKYAESRIMEGKK